MKTSALVLALPALAAVTAAQQPDKKPPQAPPEFVQAMTPGPVHKELAKLAGDYTTTTKFKVGPGASAMQSTGTAKLSMILDGRFLQEENSGTSMGEPYNGMRVLGYNNGSKKYESVWTYTMATGMMTLTGSTPDSGKTIEFTASFDNEVGARQTLQITQRRLDDDRFVVELKGKNPDGTAGPTLETTYTRKK